MVESFLQRKVYQIIAIVDSGGSNTTASYMPILIWIPTIFDNRRMCTVSWMKKWMNGSIFPWKGRWKITFCTLDGSKMQGVFGSVKSFDASVFSRHCVMYDA